MKHYIWLWSILLLQSVFAQTTAVEKQTFVVKDFEIAKPFGKKVAYSLDFNFKILLSKELENVYDNPYFLHCTLSDGSNKVIWTSSAYDSFYAHRFSPKDAIESYKSYHIPYEKLPLPEGLHQLFLTISASSQKEQFPVFFSREI